MQTITDVLPTGKANAVSSTYLCSLLGVDKRALTAAIERERRAGIPICATCSQSAPGYYLAENSEEMEEYCRSLQHRIDEISGTLAACRRTVDILSESEV